MFDFKHEYAAAGCNRHPSAADWDATTGLLAFGADRNLALWSPLDIGQIGIRCLQPGHTDIVNAVRFLPTEHGQPQMILSGSADKTIRVWRIAKPGPETVAVLEGHASTINCLAVFRGVNIIASGSADATIKLWRIHSAQEYVRSELLQTIQICPRFFPLALELHRIGADEDIILAVAGTKSVVQIYMSSTTGPFSLQATLTGHEGWIRSLSISYETSSSEGDLLLASASQDKYIRLWRVATNKQNASIESNVLNGFFEGSLSNKRYMLRGTKNTYLLTFEALLLGHEDWIYTVSWHLSNRWLQLLSASADNSVAVWNSDQNTGIWVCTTRLGEISAQKGSTTATGSAGGFWAGLWSATGENIVCIGKTGSWRLWNYDRGQARWAEGVGISGHTKATNDITWSSDGSYLLSSSSDQTTRLHAEWKREGKSSWHEMARPQIHGYDLNCLDSVSQTQFISGADEKLLRVFDAPRSTAHLLEGLSGIQFGPNQELPDAANIPVLGLSNKAVGSTEQDQDGVNAHMNTEIGTLIRTGRNTRAQGPPSEDQLARHTLWPEREKLYGHGYEISAVAACHDGTLVATSCKASSIEHAVIRLYTTSDWHEVKPALTAHSLTCTALAFSTDDQYLLSVGRDRQWAVFERDEARKVFYVLRHSNPKGHSRMILDACWGPLKAGRIFATAGRDKAVNLWKMVNEVVECIRTVTASSAITAVGLAPKLIRGDLLVALGTETGEILVHAIDLESWTIKSTNAPNQFLRPSKTITRLKWRPCYYGNPSDNEEPDSQIQLAVASEDSSVRLLKILLEV
ncbi:MAG: hypothetical protein Q9163_000637 [Psora crenata]